MPGMVGGSNPLLDLFHKIKEGGTSAQDYEARQASTQPVVQAMVGQNPNIQDRFLGQLVAAENPSGWPEAAISGANQFAIGDNFLLDNERAATKAAGDRGRALGIARRRLIEQTDRQRREQTPRGGVLDYLSGLLGR